MASNKSNEIFGILRGLSFSGRIYTCKQNTTAAKNKKQRNSGNYKYKIYIE